jgi:competence protein ComGC
MEWVSSYNIWIESFSSSWWSMCRVVWVHLIGVVVQVSCGASTTVSRGMTLVSLMIGITLVRTIIVRCLIVLWCLIVHCLVENKKYIISKTWEARIKREYNYLENQINSFKYHLVEKHVVKYVNNVFMQGPWDKINSLSFVLI